MAAKKKKATKATSKRKTSKKSASKKKSAKQKGTKKVTKKKASKKASKKKASGRPAVKKASKKTSKKSAKKATSKKATVDKKRSKKKAATMKAKNTDTATKSVTTPSAKASARRATPAVAKKKNGTRGARKKASAKLVSNEPKQAVLPEVETHRHVPSVTDAAASVDLSEGHAVPDFSLKDQAGNVHSLGDYLGSPFVLYFYPKDDTPGCTKEACGFNDELAQFEGLGMRVIGVSPDSSASHARFAEKYGLTFTLLADSDKDLSKAMGVYQLKKNYGREYMGIVRSTFLVSADGKIEKSWHGVRVTGHVPEVLESARQL